MTAPVDEARARYEAEQNTELRRIIAANVLEAMDVDKYLIDAVREARPDTQSDVPVEKVTAQHADFLMRAEWARGHGKKGAAKIWTSAADLLRYLLPDYLALDEAAHEEYFKAASDGREFSLSFDDLTALAGGVVPKWLKYDADAALGDQ
jgi:hypothetical protein